MQPSIAIVPQAHGYLRSHAARTAVGAETKILSWGRVERFTHHVSYPTFRDQLPELLARSLNEGRSVLPIGLGRSYGDVGLNGGQAVVRMTGLDRLISFDAVTGLLEVECGATLSRILDFAVPRGFFLPVVPGTSDVTIGGAIANDVHGKNHTSSGTFGRWVREIELLRTDGSVHTLGPADPTGLFAATIGGLGLTGVILRATIELKAVQSAWVDTAAHRFSSLSEYFALAREHVGQHDHTVAWIDASSVSGRGLFTTAKHRSDGELSAPPRRRRRAAFDLPSLALNPLSISAMNAVRNFQNRVRPQHGVETYRSSLFPLDGLIDWNRLYGRRGFRQYQCVLSAENAEAAADELFAQVRKSRCPPVLIVAKTFGTLVSPGIMSFPKAGTTLALDFQNTGVSVLALFQTLDRVVREGGGRLYPAKDGRMPATMFRSGYPQIDRFWPHIDPGISSSFWRRVAG